MDELIKKLWALYSCEQRNESAGCIEDFVDRTDFEEAIQAACKAQRNACARVYINPPKTDEISDCSMSSAFKRMQNNIKTAQITKEDYE